MTYTRNKLTVLRTVYPPISSADAVRLMRIPEVEAMLRTSDFYMIGGRAQARLTRPVCDHDSGELRFDFIVGDGEPRPVTIRIHELPGVATFEGETFQIQIDEAGSGFKIWDGIPDAPGAEILEWFTTEKLLWDKARGRPGICGLDNARELATYDLLYVGIAKKGDSFDRLLKRGHKARQDILSSEPQRYPGARPSDEIFLFLFKVEPLIMTTFDLGHELTPEELSGEYDAKRIVADAEKAFVSLLRPPYNGELFKSYPKGTDGLYGQGYHCYGYIIGEQMAFNTSNGTVRGGVETSGMISSDADAIFVEGETVTFYTAEAMAQTPKVDD